MPETKKRKKELSPPVIGPKRKKPRTLYAGLEQALGDYSPVKMLQDLNSGDEEAVQRAFDLATGFASPGVALSTKGPKVVSLFDKMAKKYKVKPSEVQGYVEDRLDQNTVANYVKGLFDNNKAHVQKLAQKAKDPITRHVNSLKLEYFDAFGKDVLSPGVDTLIDKKMAGKVIKLKDSPNPLKLTGEYKAVPFENDVKLMHKAQELGTNKEVGVYLEDAAFTEQKGVTGIGKKSKFEDAESMKSYYKALNDQLEAVSNKIGEYTSKVDFLKEFDPSNPKTFRLENKLRNLEVKRDLIKHGKSSYIDTDLVNTLGGPKKLTRGINFGGAKLRYKLSKIDNSGNKYHVFNLQGDLHNLKEIARFDQSKIKINGNLLEIHDDVMEELLRGGFRI